MGVIDNLMRLFSGNPQAQEAKACMDKAIALMQGSVNINYIVQQLVNLNVTFQTIREVLPKAADAFFEATRERILNSRKMRQEYKKEYIDKLDKRKAAYLAKVEAALKKLP